MTDAPKPPNSEVNLAAAIRRRFAPFGGVDDLEPPPPAPVGDPRWVAFDRTLAEVRSGFADMAPEEVEALVDEAIAAARPAVPESGEDMP